MIYVTSDLHGCSVERFQQLLDRAGFSEDDFLYILGDVIDRGEQGAELLLWITEQSNMQLLLGNHEAFLLECEFVFDEVIGQDLNKLTEKQIDSLLTWIYNGGSPTILGLKKIYQKNPELFKGIFEYLREAPLYETVEVNRQKYILVHAGLGNFRPNRLLSDYKPEELLWVRPTYDTVYYDDAIVILGHTPTQYYGSQFKGKALKTSSWICIDTGAAEGDSPMLLRLDDMKEFYEN